MSRLMTERELQVISPGAWRRKRLLLLVILLFWLIMFLLAVYLWTNVPVMYYGRKIPSSSLPGNPSLYCAAASNEMPEWYRELSAFYPTIPMPICFDSNREVLDYLNIRYTLTPAPTATP